MAAVTITMPYWRAAATFERAVGSIFGQTFTDWELVVVVDGDDEPPPAVDDPRVSVLPLTENRGFSNALAEGLALDTDATWWTPHDADDWSEPERLAFLVERIGDRDAVLAPVIEHRLDGHTALRRVQADLAALPRLRHVAWPQAGLYRLDVARKVGWRRDVRYGADSLFAAVVAHRHRPVIARTAHYHLVRQPDSLTSHRGTAAWKRDIAACDAEWKRRRR